MGDDNNHDEYDGFIECGDCECVPFPRSKGREYVRNTLTVFLFELFAVDLWKIRSKHFLLLIDYRTKTKTFIPLLIPMHC